jgi:hypothetical protein
VGRAAVRPLSELCRTRLCWTATGTGDRVEVAEPRSARSEVFHGSTREAGSKLRRRRRFRKAKAGPGPGDKAPSDITSEIRLCTRSPRPSGDGDRLRTEQGKRCG